MVNTLVNKLITIVWLLEMNRMKNCFLSNASSMTCMVHWWVADLFVLRMGLLAQLLIIKFDDQVLD
jgi:hypothetical protein